MGSQSAPNSSSTATSPLSMAPGATPQVSAPPLAPAHRTAAIPEAPVSPPAFAPALAPDTTQTAIPDSAPIPPLAPTGSTNKRPKERSTADDGDSDLSSLSASPGPKRTKKAEMAPKATSKKLKPKPAPAPKAIRKSTRKKY